MAQYNVNTILTNIKIFVILKNNLKPKEEIQTAFSIAKRSIIILIQNMSKITLRKIKVADKENFARWWRNKGLLKLTSGILKSISNKEVDKYFKNIFCSKRDYHFIITLNGKVIGHISLAKKKNSWYEMQTVIGEKKYWGKGYGSRAIKLLMKKAKRLGIFKIYLEVRPTNTRAMRAYERSGFRKVKTVLYPKNKHLPKTLKMEM